MSVKIVLGGIGSGKTRYCMEEIRALHAAQPERRCVVLVPSHFSHETEKLVIDTFGGTGLNNIEVTSFEKLARELLKGAEKRLAAPGKRAIISRAVKLALAELDRDEFDGRLLAAAGRRGFGEVAASLISELHRYCIPAARLREKAEELEDGALKQKLMLTALISDKYDMLLSAADYIDSDDDLIRLADAAGDRFGADVSLWIDKFDELLPQQLAVVRSIIDSGADITITFTYNGEDTYYGTTAAIRALSEYTEAETVRLAGSMRHISSSPDLRFLFSTWFDRSRFSGRVDNVSLFEARDVYTETEYTAGKILELVREDGYRFRDIAVICGEPENYSHIIEAVFDEYDIPYYSDDRFSIAEHPISMQILSLFDICENNWDYLSMFEYLRAGFMYLKDGGKYKRIPADDIDRMEDYVLKFGIRGRSMWCREWTKGRRTLLDEALETDTDDDEEDISSLETLRNAVAAPIAAYTDAVKGAVTVADYCSALYEFLGGINLYQGLKAELLGMAMNRATAEAQRFGQIWNLVLDILDQVNTALGESEVSAAEFAEIFAAAMGQCSIRTIPSGVDRVFIGSVDKNRSDNPRVIFAVGAVSGTFPSDTRTEGFLSNADRELLADMDVQLAPSTTLKTAKSANNVYKTLGAVTDRLYMSYPIQTPDGHACRPAQIVLDICRKLVNVPRQNDIIMSQQQEKALYVSTPAATLHKLLIRPKSNPLWGWVDEWFTEHGEWRHKLITVRGARNRYGNRVIELDPQLARSMYKGTIYYSPTHLNTYAQCPFKNFLQYGLKLREREELEITPADAGTYAHEIVRRFCEEIDGTCGWDGLSDADCGVIVDRIVAKTIENISASELYDKERMADILRRMGSTVAGVSKTVVRSIAGGGFVPLAYEKKIEVRLSPSAGITGTIDRVDVCRHDGIDEYRVIDYKTGSKSFSVADICAGLDMQPVIYSLAIAAESAAEGGSAVISGMYYNKMRNDYSHLKTTGKLSTVQSDLKKNAMLDGATFVEISPDGSPVPESVNRIESELARMNGSMFFEMKKKGKKSECEGISLGGNVRSRAVGGRLMDEVRDRIIRADREIRDGRIDISPLNTGMKTVCEYCAYSPVCKFDEEHKAPWSVEEKDNDVWDRLEGDEDQ